MKLLALGLFATSVQSARLCNLDYSSDDCSGAPTDAPFACRDGACGDCTSGGTDMITMCSADLQSLQKWVYADGNGCNGTATVGGPYSLPACVQNGGPTQRQWCSTTEDCSDEPSWEELANTGGVPTVHGAK
jgi:hypothetical protein